MRRRLLIVSAGAALLVAVTISALIWNEARKEIVFLCSNFGPGVTEQSVVRQLDTGVFLRYEKEALPTTHRIVVDSPYNLGLYRCVVELDQNHLVIAASRD